MGRAWFHGSGVEGGAPWRRAESGVKARNGCAPPSPPQTSPVGALPTALTQVPLVRVSPRSVEKGKTGRGRNLGRHPSRGRPVSALFQFSLYLHRTSETLPRDSASAAG